MKGWERGTFIVFIIDDRKCLLQVTTGLYWLSRKNGILPSFNKWLQADIRELFAINNRVSVFIAINQLYIIDDACGEIVEVFLSALNCV